MESRNKFLNVAYLKRLHGLRDRDNLTVHTYREALQRAHRPGRESRSLVHWSVEKNELYRRTRRPLLAWRPLIATNPLAVRSRETIEANLLAAWHEEDLRQLQDRSTARTAKILDIPPKGRRHPLVESGAFLDRNTYRYLIMWLLGRVCHHQDCRRCGQEKILGRQHGIDCAGVTEEVEAAFTDLMPTAKQREHQATIIDIALSQLVYDEEHLPQIKVVANAIAKVWRLCAGYQELYDASTASLEGEVDTVVGAGIMEAQQEARAIFRQHFRPQQHDPVRARGQRLNRGNRQGRGDRGGRQGRGNRNTSRGQRRGRGRGRDVR